MTTMIVNLNSENNARSNLTERCSLKRKFHIITKYNAGTLSRVVCAPEAFRKGYEYGWTRENF